MASSTGRWAALRANRARCGLSWVLLAAMTPALAGGCTAWPGARLRPRTGGVRRLQVQGRTQRFLPISRFTPPRRAWPRLAGGAGGRGGPMAVSRLQEAVEFGVLGLLEVRWPVGRSRYRGAAAGPAGRAAAAPRQRCPLRSVGRRPVRRAAARGCPQRPADLRRPAAPGARSCRSRGRHPAPRLPPGGAGGRGGRGAPPRCWPGRAMRTR